MTTEPTKNGEGSQEESKAEDSTLDQPNELEQKIIKQLEYYFGDSNLPRDKFMLEEVKLDNGWIPMSTMLKFQRLAKISSDPDVIAAAVKHSQLLEIDTSSETKKIRRSPEIPIPELNAERRQAIMERTIYCKGFPLDTDLDSVMTSINEQGLPENIFMRKYKDKLTQKYMFKGSIFATFKSVEEAKTFLEKTTTVDDKELLKMWQTEYHESKKKESQEKAENKAKKSGKKEKENATLPTFKKGALLEFSGDLSDITREDIKEALSKLEIESAFIYYNKGDPKASVRLIDENSAAEAFEKLTAEFPVKESKLAVRVIEGEEEDTFLKKAEEDRRQHMERCRKARKGGRGGGGGGRKQNFFNKRRGGKQRDDEPAAKKEKV